MLKDVKDEKRTEMGQHKRDVKDIRVKWSDKKVNVKSICYYIKRLIESRTNDRHR